MPLMKESTASMFKLFSTLVQPFSMVNRSFDLKRVVKKVSPRSKGMGWYAVSIFFLFSYSNDAVAQSNDYAARSGSIYSSIGFGLPADASSAHAIGLGLSGVSFYSPGAPGLTNPAHAGLTTYTLGNIGVGFQNFKAKDDFGSASNSLFSIDQFQFVAPLKKNRLGFSLSMNPVTRVNYRLFREGDFYPAADTVGFGVDDSGIGGVNKIEAGLGYRITKGLSVGYSASVWIASIQRETAIFFSSTNYVPVSYSEKVKGVGFGHKFGVQWSRPNTFGKENRLMVGATFQPSVTIEADRDKSGYKNVGGVAQLIDFEPETSYKKGELKNPNELNLGITYSVKEHLFISTELLLQNWSEARYTFDPAQQQAFTDRVRWGAGAQYLPFRRVNKNGFFHNLKYSWGVSYDEGSFTLNSNRIKTTMLHAGVGILNRRSTSSIDLSFRVGARGVTDNSLVRETIWGIGVSLNLAELMFIQPKFQ